ncbi:putative ribonuclease H-like domain-containing protein [Tanacetum coccineum]|uniref:Ribonuclease H-like domain-containing protein n=1 Tax=Tanacetum coccineum TaxID=301880 RepID=A0ABQ5D8U3_9ASTR
MSTQQYIVFPLWSSISSSYKGSDEKNGDDAVDDTAGKKTVQEPANKYNQALQNVLDKMMDQEKEDNDTPVNSASTSRTLSPFGPSNESSFVPFGGSFPIYVSHLPHDPRMPALEDEADFPSLGIFGNAYDDTLETYNSPNADQSVGAEADINNMEPSTVVSPIPTTRIHSIHPKQQIIGDPKSAVQTRGMTKKNTGEHAHINTSKAEKKTNHKDFQNCLFSSMQEELLQFKIQKVWTLFDLPSGKKAIGTKWVYRNKKDERGIIFRNKARLVAQGYKQEEGIDYDDVFSPVDRFEQSGFVDPEFLEKFYKVEKALYGLHQAPRAWYETLSTYLLDNGFPRGK